MNGLWRRSLRASLALAPLVVLAGCGQILDPAGPIGADEKKILVNSLAVMLLIVVPTIIATLGFAWWFRASNTKARYLPDFAYSGRVEAVVWSIPILVILFLGGMTWISSHDLDPGKPLPAKPGVQPLTVQVVSLDWKWLFIYPDQGIATVNHLVVPAGTPINFHITSASVMNAFFVPRLGSMIYSMNGMDTQLHLQADKPGRYYGRSAHFSGDGFPGMQFFVDAVPAAQFGAWVSGTKGKGEALSAQRYWQLAQQSADNPPMSFGAVQPQLFNAVLMQKIPPAPGPKLGEPDPSVRPMSVSPVGSEGDVR
ncbi:ubiquinol oxidase subunit II [Sphingomonas morindae]|uniref:Ubiquinol oxidase subunit 2 n=1 Tax=Sphingomonas morindae TaxID=1541170 RepID=A0ABY4XB24_9SPHN|nr:ubiquinol oxidase subunit II [Sphingomonas morindae]USI74058.1 ubiquinol oxidase subunit II [Sphingomonas morindae]